ncbi:MAG: methyltransferase [Candidatus Heimdallarchaeota archaeon]|nr:methyltransferase [Candidatus Heimdallarchaeota archaeon]
MKIINTGLLTLQIPHPLVYVPREDSYFLLEQIRLMDVLPVAEIGIGSGLIFLSLAKLHPSIEIIGVDVNFQACIATRNNSNLNEIDNVQIICSDLMSCFRNQSFEGLIICNPPYLPGDPIIDPLLSHSERVQFTGGRLGYELSSKLINMLEPSQELIIIISSHSTTIDQLRSMHSDVNIDPIAEMVMDDDEILWLVRVRRLIQSQKSR